MSKLYFKTGSKLLDLVVGGAKGVYGYPAGRIINIVGDRSTGKSFCANEILACNYHSLDKKNFKWVYDDCERGYTFNTEEMYGFKAREENFVSSTTVEEAFCNISNFLKKIKDDQYGIYILDSLDALTSQEQDDRAEERLKLFNNGKTLDKGTYGMNKQKYLSQEFFPQLCSELEDKNVLLIIISQVRDNMDMFSFEKFTRSGGKALDFYCHTVLWLANAKKILKNNRAVGYVIKAKTTKSKTPRPYRDCFFDLVFDYGLDDVGTNIDYLFDLRTDKGELNAQAKSVRWSGGDKISIPTLKTWLKDTIYEDKTLLEILMGTEFWDEKVNVDDTLDWVNSDKNIKKLFESKFGASMSRDELIKYIEDNELQDELAQRVEDKWEAFEDSIKSDRKKKYATQPIGED